MSDVYDMPTFDQVDEMSDDLIKRLRSPLPKYVNFSGRVHVEEDKLLAERAEAADRIEELEAKLAKVVELLKEARQDLEEYVTHEWPKDAHPVYERKWDRDMELCRRIDAVLAELER
jgi:hypothetical protein